MNDYPYATAFLKPNLPEWGLIESELKEVYNSGKFHPGEYVERFEADAAQFLGVKYVQMVSTASDGLILLMTYLHNMSEGTWYERMCRPRVAIPDFTFRATPQALNWADCDTVILDVELDGNVAANTIAEYEDYHKSRGAVRYPPFDALLAVHCFGKIIDFDSIRKQLGDRPLFVDAAHALGSVRYEKAFGDAEVFSLNITKAIPTCGEGGIIATNNEDINNYIKKARWHGESQGNLDYTIPGMNAKPTEWQAIVAYWALQNAAHQLKVRQAIVEKYTKALKQKRIQIMQPFDSDSIYKDFAIICDTRMLRKKIQNALNENVIGYKNYFSPLVSEMSLYKNKKIPYDISNAGTPNAHYLAERVICLPIYDGLSEELIEGIAGIIDHVCELED